MSGGRLAHDVAHERHVVGLDDAAQRVRDQPLGEVLHERHRIGEQRGAQLVGIAHHGAVGQLAHGVDLGAREAVDAARLAGGIEALEHEADGIDGRVAGEALRLLAVGLQQLAHGGGLLVGVGGRQRLDRGRRDGRRRAHDALEHVGAAQHRRGAVRIGAGHQHAALAQQAEARGIRELDLAELVAAHGVDVVVQRQALVEEGVGRVRSGRARSGRCG